MYNYINNHPWRVVIIITVCILLVPVFAIIIGNAKTIDSQIEAVYQKALIVERDFDSLWQMEGVTISSSESGIKVRYEEQDCTLIVTYNKNKEILTKKLKKDILDMPPILLVVYIICSPIISMFITLAIGEICEACYRRKSNMRAKKVGKKEELHE